MIFLQFLAFAAFAAESPALPPKLDLKRMYGVGFMVAPSPDGKAFAAADRNGVNLWKVGEERPAGRVEWPTPAEDGVSIFPVALSRDGNRVLFTRTFFTGDAGTIQLAIGDFGEERIVTATPERKLRCEENKYRIYRCESGGGSGSFSPDGREALYRTWYNGPQDAFISEDFVLTEKGKLRSKTIKSRHAEGSPGWLDEKNGAQTLCRYAPDGARIAARAEASFCSVVDCDSGKRRTFLEDCTHATPQPIVTLDGAKVTASLGEKGVVVWSAADGRLLRKHLFRSEAPYVLDQHGLDPYGRYLVEEHELKKGDKVVAARLNLVDLDSGKLIDSSESALDRGLYLRNVAADGTAMFQDSGQGDKAGNSVVFWSFKAKPEAGPAEPPAVAASRAVNVDAVPAAVAAIDPDAYAVVIGLEKYRQTGIPAVDYAARDARTMHAYLTGAMGFDPKNTVLLTDERAAKADLEKHLGTWLRNRVGPESRVFIYYAGHGAPNPTTGAGYLMPYEADPSYLDDTAYPLAKLYAGLDALPSKDVTVVLDACFSGQGPRSLLAKGARPLVVTSTQKSSERALVIAAAASNQISLSDEGARHGLLTYYLLEGLHGGADGNADGRITPAEAFAYAKPAVERAARLQNQEQTPTASPALSSATRPWLTLKKR